MQSTKRLIGTIPAVTLLLLGGLFFAASAEANDRHRGERINHHLDVLAFVAALSGDAYLAYSLDRRGDRIEHSYARRARHDDHRAHDRRGAYARPHRHFAGCGHGHSRYRVSRHHDDHQWRSHRGRGHRRNRRHHD